MIKQIGAFGILMALIAPSMLTISMAKLEQYAHRKSVKQFFLLSLPSNSLVRITVLTTDKHRVLEWEHAAEFEWQSDMYDVVSQEVKADSTSYHCWKDSKETVLNNQLERVIHIAWKGKEKDKELPSPDFLKKSYVVISNVLAYCHVPKESLKRVYVETIYLSLSQHVLPKPPNTSFE